MFIITKYVCCTRHSALAIFFNIIYNNNNVITIYLQKDIYCTKKTSRQHGRTAVTTIFFALT